ncbi:MAG: hypothetical protein LBL01_05610, partial [Bifidobacteriaceae bacterium]|nr:hypothetical protein [Bifidobacteriaceae bacterium]
MFEPPQDEIAARSMLLDPNLGADDLAAIAQAFPALAPQIGARRPLDPGLWSWLAALVRPDVDAALAGADSAPRLDPHGPADEPLWPGAMPPDRGAEPAGTVFAPPWQRGVPASAPAKRRNVRGLTVAVASAAVAAVAIGGPVWYVTSRHPDAGRVSGPAVPDIQSLDTLGPQIDSSEVLEGDFHASYFFDPLDDETGLAVGFNSGESTWYEGYDADYDEGFADGLLFAEAQEACWDIQETAESEDDEYYLDCEDMVDEEYYRYADTEEGAPSGYDAGYQDAVVGSEFGDGRDVEPVPSAAAVAAFDLATGDRRWQVDLIEAAGIAADAALYFVSARPDGTGAVLADVSLAGDAGASLVRIGADGAVLATWRTQGKAGDVADGIVL